MLTFAPLPCFIVLPLHIMHTSYNITSSYFFHPASSMIPQLFYSNCSHFLFHLIGIRLKLFNFSNI